MSKRKKKAKQKREMLGYELNPFFTPLFNAALEKISADPSRPDAHRAWAWATRWSMGEWSPHAVRKPIRPPAKTNLGNPLGFDTRMFGPGGCPLCHQPPAHDLPPDFRWHSPCMELIYAGEAVHCSASREELEWGTRVADRTAEMLIRATSLTIPGGIQ